MRTEQDGSLRSAPPFPTSYTPHARLFTRGGEHDRVTATLLASVLETGGRDIMTSEGSAVHRLPRG
jgi:hypothetical protein